MEVILTHENTDFDGLASLLAAKKLYPEAVPVLPRRLNRNLRHFLTLYLDELPFVPIDNLPRERIQRVILVDTQNMITLRGMGPWTREVCIIDHHPLSRELEPGWTYTGGEAGSTTTILVEQMSALRVELSSVEATLLLLGIYEDTGSLSYPSTTARDARCVAWLLERGGRLQVVNSFLHYPLSPEQRQLYEQLLESSETYTFNGQSVIVATARAEGYVEEISTLAHKLRDVFDPDGLFVLVELDEHLQLVARSSTDTINVAAIAAELGGGGHSRAAAALIREQTVSQVKERLLSLLEVYVQPAITVRQIMSYGVHTLSPDITIERAEEEAQRWGHEGFPVVDKGRIVGVLTRREIDKALHHGLGKAKISTYMHKGEVFVTPDDSVEHLQRVMMEHGLGQVPVVEKGEVIGIVTRTDLIKLWSESPRPSRREEIVALIENALPPPLLDLIREASQTASDMGYALYFVGGFVRDLLLGIPNFDIDLVVEGDAIKLAKRLRRQVGGRVRSHARFGTAKLLFDNGGARYGIPSLDFVTARAEFYEHPTALPQVERSSIKQDLHRRDFTINTLAIRLDPEHYGELLDFYGGEQDLRNGLIRVLHSLSFVEDPTRTLRAVRFEQRLGFRIEPRTEELIANALDLLDRISGERIRHELILIFQEEEPEKCLARLHELKILQQIHPGLYYDEWLGEKFRQLRQAMRSGDWPEEICDAPKAISTLYLALLTYRLSAEELEALITRLKIPRDDAELLRQVSSLRPLEARLAAEDHPPSTVVHWLERHTLAALFVLWVATDSSRVRHQIERYCREWRFVHSEIDGQYLKTLGLRPGPIFGRILRRLRDARLDGEIVSLEEEKALVEQILAESNNNERGEQN
ncbi:MAG: CBS domain-containing protein [Anaerolineae bacterium]|nr:CBS domain-containing protein [Anaerolineae bacterium]